jgi:hypothetical protein
MLLRPRAYLPMLILLAASPHAAVVAQDGMTIYRCVDAAGAITLQNDVPCPKGSAQTIRKVGALPTLPAPQVAPSSAPAAAAAPRPVPAAAPAPTPQPPPAPAVRMPPPALFQCRTWDDRDYLGDTAEPPAACVPLETVGIDGSSTLAAGQACEMRRDTCTAVPTAQLCAAWKKRVDEAEFRWKFGGSRNDDRKAEFDRVTRVYRDSTCAG